MPHVRLTGFVPWRAAALAVGVALFATACNPGGSSAAGGASGSASASSSAPASASSSDPAASGSQAGSALCADVAALHASVLNLTHVKLSKATASTLSADVNDVTTKLTTLSNAANGQWSTETGALQTALGSLQTSLHNVTTGTGISSLTRATTDFGQVIEYTGSLLSAARSSCPSVPSMS